MMEQEEKHNISKPRSNRKPGRSLTVVVMFFTAILLLCLVLLFWVSRRIDSLSGADTQIKLSGQGGFSCEYSEAQKLYPFGEGVLKVTNERISYLTLSGNEVYSADISYQNPQCVSYGVYAAVFDLNGYSFSVLTQDKLLFTVPTENQVKAVTISSTGLTAVITDNGDSYGDVILYDTAGNMISDWSSYNSGYPICCSFNDSSDELAISTLNTSGAVLVPYIRLFSITSADDGVHVADKSIYTTEDSTLFSSMYYCNNKLYCFTANSVYQIENDSLSQINFDFSAISHVDKVGNRLFIAYSDGVSQLNKLAVIDSSNTVLYNSDIGSVINAVSVTGDTYAISVDKRVFIYNSNGTVTNDFSVDEDIIRMNFISGNKLCVVSTGGVHTLN